MKSRPSVQLARSSKAKLRSAGVQPRSATAQRMIVYKSPSVTASVATAIALVLALPARAQGRPPQKLRRPCPLPPPRMRPLRRKPRKLRLSRMSLATRAARSSSREFGEAASSATFHPRTCSAAATSARRAPRTSPSCWKRLLPRSEVRAVAAASGRSSSSTANASPASENCATSRPKRSSASRSCRKKSRSNTAIGPTSAS